ncbi:hypothetical protein MF451_003730 [Salmonella enterica subsp. enterica serovar Saintpaul]|nr:hypothetical protein [Salmonella enterica subsp. enterica serovar Saintpaul]
MALKRITKNILQLLPGDVVFLESEVWPVASVEPYKDQNGLYVVHFQTKNKCSELFNSAKNFVVIQGLKADANFEEINIKFGFYLALTEPDECSDADDRSHAPWRD